MAYVPQTRGQATMANSNPVTMASNQTPVAMSRDTSSLKDGATSLTPKFAKISATNSGSTQVVAAVTGKKIRVIKYSVITNIANVLKFKSSTTDLTGSMSFGANGGISEPECSVGHFETVAGEALNIDLGSGSAVVGGSLVYVEV